MMSLPHRCTVAITAVDRKIFLRFEPRVTPRQTIGDEAGLAIGLDRIGFDLCSDIEDHGGVSRNESRTIGGGVPYRARAAHPFARRGWTAGKGSKLRDRRELRKSSRGIGFAKRNPCPLSKPRPTRHRRSSIVSMPSAQVVASKR
jgi:hypothetical protein